MNLFDLPYEIIHYIFTFMNRFSKLMICRSSIVLRQLCFNIKPIILTDEYLRFGPQLCIIHWEYYYCIGYFIIEEMNYLSRYNFSVIKMPDINLNFTINLYSYIHGRLNIMNKMEFLIYNRWIDGIRIKK